jgi:hypothetical protein
MSEPRLADRAALRLNARRFEAFVRGGPRRGTLSLHRKLDGAELARGTWRAAGRHVVLQLSTPPRAAPVLAGALAELAPLWARRWPRARLLLGLQYARHPLRMPLAARGAPALTRRGGSPADLAARVRIATVLREIPADYAATRRLPRVAEARVLALAGLDLSGRECWLRADVARRWRAMQARAARDGVSLALVSGFRSAAYQARILERKRARGEPMAGILGVNAAPGHSEHHGGRAADLGTPGCAPVEPDFEHTPAFAWLQANATHLRLRMSYPRDNPHGIMHEPWHWFFEH